MRAILFVVTLFSAVGASAVGSDKPIALTGRRAAARAARQEHVELLLRQAPTGECDFVAAAAAVRRLADEAVAAGDHAAAVRWHEQWVAAVRKFDTKANAALAMGTGSVGLVAHRAKAARIEAEVDLIRRRGGGSASLIELLKERVALCAESEKLAAKVMAVSGHGLKGDYLEAKVARLDAEAELASAEADAKKGGK
ncbi:hypothetical protein GobsT_21570 [Gemmata obscuriglobus]|uniref:DUF5667 domain-containing protein n=1 Tax=Gemmata obscuriglobus TaxID=114 RepID=A0A2Z3H193_9BACT|nr:hypothetical protein [Gemmata obscuriglobus]AWM39508.1 hypothetical protein C1280_22605 [Gemmata obscuriglobus]QEG27401.1 hypothetical protein GobsT_21570 [Gemmata obscuriglobus]VTS04317.1 unnamed protein product [Gemmata obscuriglobus UQM 2246]